MIVRRNCPRRAIFNRAEKVRNVRPVYICDDGERRD